ncbi:MAG: ATP-binding protein [Bacteroidales bacterium]|nr:ATP-binding protein [Bacteroidales bacterium]
MLRFKAEENNVALSYEVDKQVNPLLITDVGKLQRVLINLTENAIKFNKDGTAKVSVKLPEDINEEAVVFEIKDTGIGMDPKFIKTIHNEFDQSDNTATRKYEGSGMGLYISLELLRVMSAKTFVDSNPGKGTRIAFKLPVQQQQDSKPLREDHPDANESKKYFPHLHMLIAEDNRSDQLVASRALTSLQISHDITSNGIEAVEMVKENHYDAILMDLMMPEMDGFEATIVIRRELKKDIPVIACTAKKVKGTLEDALKQG